MKKYVLLAIILIIMTLASHSENLVSSQNYKFVPNNNEVIYDCNSAINVSFPFEVSQILDLKSVKVILSGVDITKKCSFRGNSINYLPIMPLPEGKNTVEITGKDKNKDNLDIKWSFMLKPQNDDITSIGHDVSGILIESEVLSVTIKGNPSGKAYFDIGGKIKNIPMKEVSPGVYAGSYKIKSIDNYGIENIIGHIKFNSRLESSIVCKDKISLKGDLFMVKIISPLPNEKVGSSFEIVGRTKPHAQVLVSSLVWLKNIPIVNDLKANTGGYEAMADEDGVFKMKYGIPFKFKESTLTLRFLAKDDKGNYSIPNTMTLTQK